MKIYTSPYPEQPVPNESIFTFLFETVYSNTPASRIAYTDALTGQKITREETKKLSLSFGYGLTKQFQKLGGVPLKRGDTVLLFTPNSLAFPLAFFGSIAAGLKVSPANAAYTTREILHQWKDSNARVAFVHPVLLPVIVEMLKGLKLDPRKHIIVADFGLPAEATLGAKKAGLIPMSELLGKGSLEREEKFPGEQAQETVVLFYSSGTTGVPKGVEITHRNVVSVLKMIDVGFPMPREAHDSMLAVVPFFHITGATNVMQFMFYNGVNVVIMAKFDPVEYCKTIEKYKITQTIVVPPILLVLLHHPASNQYDLRSLTFIASGAAPLKASLAAAVQKKFKDMGVDSFVTQGYGLTETTSCCHLLQMKDCVKKVGSIGPLLGNSECRLVADDDQDAPEGGPGELWVRGPSVMKGYLNNPGETKKSITADGWFKTGDIAIRDPDGYYYIVDRKKELIKYKGFQVPPAELENLLLEHPEIVDAAVIGVELDTDREVTEVPRAFVVYAKGKNAAPKSFPSDVQKWIESRVAKHKYLRGGVEVVDAIPKSAAGKILRKDLRARL